MADNLTHPLEHKWSVYVHGTSDSNTYTASYRKWLVLKTCEDYGDFCANLPLQLLFDNHRTILKIKGVNVTTISIFKDSIKPEWEDTHNENGSTLSLRTVKEEHLETDTWKHILAFMIGHTSLQGDINGMQLTLKRSQRIGILFKVDIWLPAHTSTKNILDDLLRTTNASFEFIERT